MFSAFGPKFALPGLLDLLLLLLELVGERQITSMSIEYLYDPSVRLPHCQLPVDDNWFMAAARWSGDRPRPFGVGIVSVTSGSASCQSD